jgi:hypothetical protein
MDDNRLLISAKRGRRSAGQTDLINYLTGKRLTQRQAIQAHCYDCNGMGELKECDNSECSLLSYSLYNRPPRPHFCRGTGENKGRGATTPLPKHIKSPRALQGSASADKKGIVERDAAELLTN